MEHEYRLSVPPGRPTTGRIMDIQMQKEQVRRASRSRERLRHQRVQLVGVELPRMGEPFANGLPQEGEAHQMAGQDAATPPLRVARRFDHLVRVFADEPLQIGIVLAVDEPVPS